MYEILLRQSMRNDNDTLIIPVFKEKLKVIDEKINAKLARLINKNVFNANLGEIEVVEVNGQDIVFVGLGELEKLCLEDVRKVFGRVNKNLRILKSEYVSLDLTRDASENVQEMLKAIIEGCILSDYNFDKYLKSEELKVIKLEIILEMFNQNLISEINKTKKVCEIIHEVRDLINEPSNVIYPESLAKDALKKGEKYGFQVEVLGEDEICKLGMDAFLSVGKGSNKESKLIVMRYMGNEKDERILGLVGKGLTYDSGGYSIKSTESMIDMKADMGGAAVVMGVMSAIAENKIKANVVGVIPACENVISAESYKPGDIIKSMAGKTIEVMNVDAEGRLTLIDGITYAIKKESVCKIIDVATLTHTVRIALGKDVAAGITNNEGFYKELENAITKTNEKIWRMPNYEDYKELFKSDIADLKNYGDSYAKVISAGMFIGEFVEGKPWIHLDIAGPSFIDKNKDYEKKGGTGFSVRTLYQLIVDSI